MDYNKRLARSVVRFIFSRKETFRQRRQRGGVLLIPGLDATFAVKGSPDWMAVTKDAVWVFLTKTAKSQFWGRNSKLV